MIYENEEFIYDTETGELRHAIDKNWNAKAGELVTGALHAEGYLRTTYTKNDRKCAIYQHILIWEIVMGRPPLPDKKITHVNQDRIDNRWKNLKEVTRHQANCIRKSYQAKTTPIKGIYRFNDGRYRVALHGYGPTIHLGIAATYDDAKRMRYAGEQRYKHLRQRVSYDRLLKIGIF